MSLPAIFAKNSRSSTISRRSKLSPPFLSLSTSAFALAACGGGEEAISGEGASSSASGVTQAGVALKGLLEDFRVFVDSNGNGVYDAGEANALSAADGSFSLAVPTGSALSGEVTSTTVDHASGRVIEGLFLSAPSGASILSPMTTIIQQTGLSEAEVRQAFGLSVNLLEYNPFAAANVTSDATRAVEQVAQQVANITRNLTAVGEGTGLSSRTAFDIASAAFNSVVTTHITEGTAGSLDLWGDATMTSVLDAYRAGLVSAGHSVTAFDALRTELDAGLDIINQRILAVADPTSTEAQAVFGLPTDFYNEIKAAAAAIAAGNANPGLSLDSWTAITAKVAENGYTPPAPPAPPEPPAPPAPAPVLTVNAPAAAFTVQSDINATLEMTGGAVLGNLVAGNAFTLTTGGAVATGTLFARANGQTSVASAQTFTLGTAGNDVIDTSGAGARVDYILGGAGDDNIDAGAGNDYILGGSGNDTITGGAGADVINAGAGANVITDAGVGEDTISHNAASSTVQINATGSDWINVAALAVGVTVTISGDTTTNRNIDAVQSSHGVTIDGQALTSGRGTYIGGVGNDTITGGDGDDWIRGRSGADSLIGGKGNDVYEYLGTFDVDGTETITELTGEGTDQIRLQGTTDFSVMAAANFDEIEEINIAGAFTATFTGAQLTGETISLIGADGVQEVVVNATAGGTTDLSGISAGTNWTAGTDRVIIDGSSSADTIIGTATDDTITGGAGADSLTGGDGDDLLIADDTDTIDGGDDNDTAVFTAAVSAANLLDADLVNVENVGVIGAYNFDFSAQTEALNISGSSGTGDDAAKTIVGGAGGDTILGGSGNDTITGGAGADRLFGGDGDDIFLIDAVDKVKPPPPPHHLIGEVIHGGSGIDIIRFISTKPSDILTLTADVSVETIELSDANGLTTGTATTGIDASNMASPENVSLRGNDGANQLTGNGGNNTISGGGGDDTIRGGAGSDLLTGGAGSDDFYMNLNNDGVDKITDFQVLADNVILELTSLKDRGGVTVTSLDITNLSFASIDNIDSGTASLGDGKVIVEVLTESRFGFDSGLAVNLDVATSTAAEIVAEVEAIFAGNNWGGDAEAPYIESANSEELLFVFYEASEKGDTQDAVLVRAKGDGDADSFSGELTLHAILLNVADNSMSGADFTNTFAIIT
ncbi:hypothetical protein OE810_02170 [Rhodobacteraceae bacterium XHP0102]|nr:hypothetical protein [Rhodobacteraceae bacterium XHP0102]